MQAGPENIARTERLRRLATYASVSVGSTLVVAKLVAWLITDSVTLLSSMLDSMVDVAASLITLVCVRAALRPADHTHRFGHGKAEPLGALAQAAFIGGSGVLVVIQAIGRLIEPAPVVDAGVGYAVMALSIVLTLALVLFQRHAVRVTGSLAIAADKLHYAGDLLTNLAVVATLVAVSQTGWLWLDPLVALGIAGYLLWNALVVGRDAYNVLMDRELPQADRERISAIVRHDRRVRGMHDLRTRSSSTTRFIELHLELDGGMTLREAHVIADAVEEALAREFPATEILVHQEPAGLEDARLDRRLAAG